MSNPRAPFDPSLLTHEPSAERQLTRLRKIGFLVFPDFEIIDLCGPLDAFYYADRALRLTGRVGEPGYEVLVIAAKAGLVRSKCGMEINAAYGLADVTGGLDTLIVSGGEGMLEACADDALIGWLKAMSTQVRRVASICTGAFLLARAGLLDNRRVTTHWLYCDQLASMYPSLAIESNRIFVRDGAVYTSGGITAGIDLALSLIEEDLGRDVPRMVAGLMVVFLRRPGGQAQFSPYLQAEPSNCRDIGELKSWILGNPGEDLSVERLACQLAMSPRNFARRFHEEVGETPAKFVERARLEAARCRLEQTTPPLEAIAQACGFGTAERMRRSFQRQLNVSPHEYRERFQSTFTH